MTEEPCDYCSHQGTTVCNRCEQSNEFQQVFNDPIEQPKHYEIKDGYEVIDLIRDKLTPEQFKGYCMGNIYKYTLRWDKKNGIEDLKKSQQYHKILLEFLKLV